MCQDYLEGGFEIMYINKTEHWRQTFLGLLKLLRCGTAYIKDIVRMSLYHKLN